MLDELLKTIRESNMTRDQVLITLTRAFEDTAKGQTLIVGFLLIRTLHSYGEEEWLNGIVANCDKSDANICAMLVKLTEILMAKKDNKIILPSVETILN